MPFTYRDSESKTNSKYQILFKSEDVRKDLIIMNIIKLMDLILKKEEGLDLNIVTYDVKPTSIDSGIIEMVPNCETIYKIKEKMKFSILNYIIENNPDEKIDVVKNRFLKSCAAYSIITYLLGIGDRHLDNIMVTQKGVMFHIDFGFIFRDPKPMTPQMRITSDMMDALGGANSASYQEFKDLCNRINNCLRGHVSIFLNMIYLLADADPIIDNRMPFTRKNLKREVVKRFVPGESIQEANLQLSSQIENSSNYNQFINDFFHYHAQENTIQNALSDAIEGTRALLNGIYSMFTKGA